MTAVDIARAEALFASDLSRDDNPTGVQIRRAAGHVLNALGPVECAARMAQAYGDDQTSAAARMRWCLEAVRDAFTHSRV